MNNLPFVIWMLGWSFYITFSDVIQRYFNVYQERDNISNLIILSIWVFVSYILYRKD